MDTLMRIVIGCVVVGSIGSATAAPKPAARPAAGKPAAPARPVDPYVAANVQVRSGAYKDALATVDAGLAAGAQGEPLRQLLKLKGSILISLRDIEGAIVAYQGYIDAGATGQNRAEAQKIVQNLKAAPVVDIKLASGSADVYLDSKAGGVFCTAAPTCSKKIMPGPHRLTVERAGYEPKLERIKLEANKPAAVDIALVELSSLLTVKVAQAEAQITVDDAPYTGPVKLPGGDHRVVVTLAHHAEAHLTAAAHGGAPVDLDVALVPLVPVQVQPPGAELVLDGKPVAVEAGNIAVPAGAHHLIARAPGYRDQATDIPAELPAEYKLQVALARIPPPVPEQPHSLFTTRRKIALAAGGVAIVGGVVGAILGHQAKGDEDDSFALCPSPTTPCKDALKANDLNSQGRSRATQANIAFGVAGASAAAAVILWLTGAPESSRVAVAPHIGGAVTGLDVSLRF